MFNGLQIGITVFSIIGTILIGISVFPQTIKTMRDHQTTQINIVMYIFLVLGCAGLGIYGISLVSTGNTLIGANVGNPTGNVLNYIVPGAMLIFGEFFCSITSAIVLVYKFINIKKAKMNNMTEIEYCKKFIAEHPNRGESLLKNMMRMRGKK